MRGLKELPHSCFSFLLQISSEPFSVKDYQLIQYLIPDGVDTLGAALHVIFQTGSIELFLDWLDEAGDIGIALQFLWLIGILLP